MTKVKICGLTNYQDAYAAVQAGANYLGFIINYPASPRNNTPERVSEIVRKLRSQFPAVGYVGVFVNCDLNKIKEIISVCLLDVVQLHGEESAADCRALRPIAEVWKAIVVKSGRDLQKINEYRPYARKIMVDSGRGSGQLINPALLQNYQVDVVAGGISPDNVREIIAMLNPEIVDVNSGIEKSPGIKDYTLIKNFFEQI